MRKLIALVIGLVLCSTAWAGFRAFNGTSDLKIFNSIKCSTGMTCSRTGDDLTIVSSPTLAADLTLGDGTAVDRSLIYDGNAQDFNISLDDSTDDLVIGLGSAAGTTDAIRIDENQDVTFVQDILPLSTITGDGGAALVGMLQSQVAATATTITAAQCGASFINTGAVQMELPEASAVLGCRLTFITGNASNFDVNPDDADQILVETDAAGDAMRNATLGNSITIEAISATQWAPVGVIGTWTDIN